MIVDFLSDFNKSNWWFGTIELLNTFSCMLLTYLGL